MSADSLGARVAFQSTGFFVVLFALIFAPEWSLHAIAPWVFLATFMVGSSASTAWLFAHDRALLERRLAMGERGEPRTKQKIIQSILGLAFVGMLAGSAVDRRAGYSHVPLVASLVADGFVLLGFFFVMLVFRANTFTSAVVEVAKDQTVVTTGPYAIVRHPMYSSAALLVFATPIALGSWLAEVFAAILMIGVVVRLLDEERLLVEELPGYANYKTKTRWRLVPFVW